MAQKVLARERREETREQGVRSKPSKFEEITTMSKTPASHYNDQTGQRERWPVLVYRLQSHRGWEVYTDPDMSKKGGKSPKEELTAAPREGCIEVFKMRLRISLFKQNARKSRKDCDGGTVVGTVAGTQDDGATVADQGVDDEMNGRDDNDIPGPDGWNNNALVVRRLNTLLVSTRRGVGAIVFKFKSNQDCIEFCDRLVYLNRDYFTNNADKMGRGYVNGMDSREQYCEKMKEVKRRRLTVMRDQQLIDIPAGSEGGVENKQESTVHDVKQTRRQNELFSYIVRLAHDEEFRQYVDEVERGLQSAPETEEMYNALGF